MKNDADPRWQAVELGIAVEHLIASAPVQQMVVDAENERAELTEAIVKLDLDLKADRKTFRRNQARIAVLDTWQQFFADYVERGKAAAEALEIEDTPLGGEATTPDQNPEGES